MVVSQRTVSVTFQNSSVKQPCIFFPYLLLPWAFRSLRYDWEIFHREFIIGFSFNIWIFLRSPQVQSIRRKCRITKDSDCPEDQIAFRESPNQCPTCVDPILCFVPCDLVEPICKHCQKPVRDLSSRCGCDTCFDCGTANCPLLACPTNATIPNPQNRCCPICADKTP